MLLNSVSSGLSKLCLDSSLRSLRERSLLVTTVRKFVSFGNIIMRVFLGYVLVFVWACSYPIYYCCMAR
jgi:hypothetical protein